jgi:hypothetical protein
MVVRCFGDNLAGFVDDDFHALPPMQRPASAAAMLHDGSNLAPAQAFQAAKPVNPIGGPKGQLYFRLRRVRVRLSRLAFAATFLRYCSTIFSPDAPAIRLVPAFAAAIIFSLTMRRASRWAALPPRINFAMRSPITRLLSSPSIIQFHMLRYSRHGNSFRDHINDHSVRSVQSKPRGLSQGQPSRGAFSCLGNVSL